MYEPFNDGTIHELKISLSHTLLLFFFIIQFNEIIQFWIVFFFFFSVISYKRIFFAAYNMVVFGFASLYVTLLRRNFIFPHGKSSQNIQNIIIWHTDEWWNVNGAVETVIVNVRVDMSHVYRCFSYLIFLLRMSAIKDNMQYRQLCVCDIHTCCSFGPYECQMTAQSGQTNLNS